MNETRKMRSGCHRSSGLDHKEEPNLDKFRARVLTLEADQIYNDRYLFALLGILTYGQLEVIDKFILHMPSHVSRGNISRQVDWIFVRLFPQLPEEVQRFGYIDEVVEAIKDWFDQYQDQLIWDQDAGKYKLKGSKLTNDIQRIRTSCHISSRLNFDDKEPSIAKFRARALALNNNKFTRYLFALLGILSYGELDVVDEFIDHLPVSHSPGNILQEEITKIFIDFFPFPEALGDPDYFRQQLNLIRQWFSQNRDQLIWDEVSGKYELKNLT